MRTQFAKRIRRASVGFRSEAEKTRAHRTAAQARCSPPRSGRLFLTPPRVVPAALPSGTFGKAEGSALKNAALPRYAEIKRCRDPKAFFRALPNQDGKDNTNRKDKNMRESILTIPINEVFEPREGCPICAMRNTVEQHISEYIMGAAMMEPDVRIETNKLGFCGEHYNMLLKQNNRLSLALMLNTHLAERRAAMFDGKGGLKRYSKKSELEKQTCFVCEKVNWGIEHMLDTLFNMWNDEGFQRLYASQKYICIRHYDLLMVHAMKKLKKDKLQSFVEVTDKLVNEYMKQLGEDVQQFCDSFDYRNAAKLHNDDMEHVRSSIERSIEFLTSRKPEVKK